MKYNEKSEIVNDLAQSYEIKDDGKTYEFRLKDNIFWHDGELFTIDDVIYTIKIIQNPDYKSPLGKNWLGVDAEKVDDKTIRFKMKNPYAPFLENTTLKILPKHIWQNIPPENFPLAIHNLQPVGTGPFKFQSFEQDKLGFIKSLSLKINSEYFGKKPYLENITFKYFQNDTELAEALKYDKIDGINYISPKDILTIPPKFEIHRSFLPRYLAVFLNPSQSKILAEKDVKIALNYAANKEEILKNALRGEGKIINSPILSGILDFPNPSKIYEFNPELAKDILKKAGYTEQNGDGWREKITKKEPTFTFKSSLKEGSGGKEVEELQKCLAEDKEVYPSGKITGSFDKNVKQAVIKFQEKYSKEILEPSNLKKGTGIIRESTRKKLNELCAQTVEEVLPLQISLATINQPEMAEVANIIKNNWEAIGVKTDVKLYERAEIENEIIKPRNYDALLFGEVLSYNIDPLSFWHSSQKKNSGLNLSMYENKDADKLLEEARQILDDQKRKEKYIDFQNILVNDSPAIFLYSSYYLYPVSTEIKGINTEKISDSSKRFNNIGNWYIKTKRYWKNFKLF